LIDSLARVGANPETVSRLFSEMERAGVRRAVLFPEDLDVPIERLTEARGKYPGRFAVAAAVDPLAPTAAALVEEFRLRRGAAGIELRSPESCRRWLNAPEVMPLWEKLEELGVPTTLCIASQDYNQFSDVVTTFPSLRVILQDLGSGPGTLLSQYVPILLEYARYPQVHVGISRLFRISSAPYPHRDVWPVLEEVYRAFGARRLVWGSAYPEVLAVSDYSSSVRLLEELPFVAAGDLERIRETNAARLWFESPL